MRKALYHILRYTVLMIGFALIGFSAVMMVKSGLGAAPWDVFHTGLTNVLPVTLGQASIGAGVVFIIVAFIMGVKPYIGTILNMIFIGIFMDLTIYLNIFPAIPESLLMRIVYLVLGTFICSIGAAVYFSANLQYGPRDSLMMAINKRTPLSIRSARTILEIAAVFFGWLMGGVFGLGTIFFALTTGSFLLLGINGINKFKAGRWFKIFTEKFYYCDQKEEDYDKSDHYQKLLSKGIESKEGRR